MVYISLRLLCELQFITVRGMGSTANGAVGKRTGVVKGAKMVFLETIRKSVMTRGLVLSSLTHTLVGFRAIMAVSEC